MLVSSLLFVPILGVFLIAGTINYQPIRANIYPKIIGFVISIINFLISLIIYIIFDFSANQYKFVQEQYEMTYFDLYLGIDGISIYFILLTTLIIPLALLSN